jgi:hypothetical protein
LRDQGGDQITLGNVPPRKRESRQLVEMFQPMFFDSHIVGIVQIIHPQHGMPTRQQDFRHAGRDEPGRASD